MRFWFHPKIRKAALKKGGLTNHTKQVSKKSAM